eukprot:6201133-Pleurochrysis_carterae.AAC.4
MARFHSGLWGIEVSRPASKQSGGMAKRLWNTGKTACSHCFACDSACAVIVHCRPLASENSEGRLVRAAGVPAVYSFVLHTGTPHSFCSSSQRARRWASKTAAEITSFRPDAELKRLARSWDVCCCWGVFCSAAVWPGFPVSNTELVESIYLDLMA